VHELDFPKDLVVVFAAGRVRNVTMAVQQEKLLERAAGNNVVGSGETC